MPVDDALPGAAEGFPIQTPFPGIKLLHEVNAGTGVHQRMEQHAFLHRRQRVTVLDLPPILTPTCQLLRRQPGERKDRYDKSRRLRHRLC